MDVTLAEMRALVRDPAVTILDVRPREGYASAHLPRALGIPGGELRDRASVELPDRSRPIIVYCASPT